ncbi:haloacid dehalogenase type II [Curvibacter sp. HBC61]|uniref:(S)-2-haloacid dehalogenase n=1 Tax=Curvibacter cyanobacteriorum TaxID=3026422 RepID=A0ABT5N3H6_9BURK|nr:haloacid dehalogenase type II [Curvibacter sp. HBC61]MDD0840632.1 haloacid dehalogenase type II [Curvibacter sp. HBC61]
MDKRRALTAATAPQAVWFDAYGTLFDVDSVALLAEQLYPGQGLTLSRLWRDKQIEASHLLSAADQGAHYQPFWALTQAALRYAAARLELVLTPAREQQFMNQYRALSTFPETREVLKALKERGVRTGILSNGDPDMLAVAVRSAGLDPWLDHVMSVDAVRRYKPHPDCYALGPQHSGVAARDTVFVSSNGWDALGATWFGYTTLWVNRQGLPPEPLGPAPSRTGQSLRDVLDFFPAV